MMRTFDTDHDLARRDDWVHAWPLRKPGLVVLAKGGVLLLVIWTAIGGVFMAFLDGGPVGDADRAGARWLEDRRTPMWDTVTHVGSMLSDTLVKVALLAIVGGAMVVAGGGGTTASSSPWSSASRPRCS